MKCQYPAKVLQLLCFPCYALVMPRVKINTHPESCNYCKESVCFPDTEDSIITILKSLSDTMHSLTSVRYYIICNNIICGTGCQLQCHMRDMGTVDTGSQTAVGLRASCGNSAHISMWQERNHAATIL